MSHHPMNAQKVLIVDDDEMNLDILEEYLEEAGYLCLPARNGLEAWNMLLEHPDTKVILLDRMMPVMDGMATLKKIRQDRRFQRIPVIMQTAAAGSQQILEGLQEGVFYYLPKPFDKQTLLSIVGAARQNPQHSLELIEPEEKQANVATMLQQAGFSFRTLGDVNLLAPFISQSFPDPSSALLGLTELMVNAVEHGNLGIASEEKQRLIIDGIWQEEIERRLALVEYRERMACLTLEKTTSEVTVIIQDQGEGFDFRQYGACDPRHITNLNGRGICLARLIGFDHVEYKGCGNTVHCRSAINTTAGIKAAS